MRKSVGWVERSETHHRKSPWLMGFASAQPILRLTDELGRDLRAFLLGRVAAKCRDVP